MNKDWNVAMTHQIDEKTAERLGKVLGLLGSEHDGERAAAAAKAHSMLVASGLTWSDLAKAVVRKPERKMPEMGTWRATCRECLDHARDLRAWEREFLTDLPKFPRISTKQRYCLNEIAIRLGIRERRA